MKVMNNTVFCLNSLIIEIYIIGFKYEGEAILFFIKCDDIVQFSGLVDCFETNEHMIENILGKNKVNELNFICWTHPDHDHSQGLNHIVEKFSGTNTCLWIPEDIENVNERCSTEIKDFFRNLKKDICKKKSKYRIYTASDYKNLLAYNPINFNYRGEDYNLEIFSLAPNSSEVKSLVYRESFEKNNRSIVLHIHFNKINLLLTGDIENDMIEYMPKHLIPKDNDLIKIPHHGSSTSDKMLENIGNNNFISCSTVYRKGSINLPNDKIMKQYANQSNSVFCTGKNDTNKETCDFGIFQIKFDVINLTNNITTKGNAEIWK